MGIPPWSGSRRTRARATLNEIRWRALLYVPAAVAFARVRRRVGPPPAPVTLTTAYAVPVVIAYALPRGRARTCLVWLGHMWAYKVAFEVPHDRRHAQRARLRVDQPLVIDRAIGFGIPLTQRLQRRLRRPPDLTALDRALAVVYLAWELEPHLALAWLLWRHPARFAAAAARLGLTFDATLIGYYAAPTAPPWWASEFAGRMDGQVHRVNAEVIRALRGEPRPGTPDDHCPGSNPWAAWPSDHFASTLCVAMALAEVDWRAGALGFAYAAALAFTLVYSGEHYVVDLLQGGALALAVQAGGRRVIPGLG